ncbi:MAG: hypothetical protein IT376_15375 [Polyangiaceae bacterium]|nr:hypothetical protein [Polyangiaceae bacterium]
MSSGRWRLGLAVLTAALFGAPPAAAQEWITHGEVGAGTGLEGADRGEGGGFQRARTRIFAGVDLSVDETPDSGFGVRGFVEIERETGVGGSARYLRHVSRYVTLSLAGTAILVPATLFGGGVGAQLALPLGDEVAIFAEPGVSAFPFGGDRPGDGVVTWFSLDLGLRVGL